MRQRERQNVCGHSTGLHEILSDLDAQTPLLHGRTRPKLQFMGTFSAGPPSGGGGQQARRARNVGRFTIRP